MVRPPSLKETVRGLAEQLPEVLTHWFCQVSVDLRGSNARMSEQDLDQPDVHSSLEQVRGEAVAERVRSKSVVEAALASRFMERVPSCGIGQVGDDSVTGEEPLLAAVRLPDLSEHLQNRFGQRERPFFVALANQAKHHLL